MWLMYGEKQRDQGRKRQERVVRFESRFYLCLMVFVCVVFFGLYIYIFFQVLLIVIRRVFFSIGFGRGIIEGLKQRSGIKNCLWKVNLMLNEWVGFQRGSEFGSRDVI